MNGHIILGLFALYVACISLGMVLTGRQDDLFLRLRRFWGRRIGHSLYFLLNVATPLIICALSLGCGVRNYDTAITVAALNEPSQLRLTVKPLPKEYNPFLSPVYLEPGGIIYGA